MSRRSALTSLIGIVIGDVAEVAKTFDVCGTTETLASSATSVCGTTETLASSATSVCGTTETLASSATNNTTLLKPGRVPLTPTFL